LVNYIVAVVLHNWLDVCIHFVLDADYFTLILVD
jgi:hypothetical protein